MIAKMSENATIPTRGSPLAAGYDLYSAEVRFFLIYLVVLQFSLLGHYDSCSRQGSGEDRYSDQGTSWHLRKNRSQVRTVLEEPH